MVEKVITSPRDVVDFACYRARRDAAGKTLAIASRTCRHCGAALADGESENECSSTFNVEAPGLRGSPRRFYAE